MSVLNSPGAGPLPLPVGGESDIVYNICLVLRLTVSPRFIERFRWGKLTHGSLLVPRSGSDL